MREAIRNEELRGDEKRVLNLASRLWPWTYGAGMTDRQVGDAIVERLFESDRLSETAAFGEPSVRREDENWVRALCFAAKWADAGYPKIVCSGHKYAAAMMCTSLSREADVILPWPAFQVAIPNGLMETPAGDFTHVRVWSFGETYNLEVVNQKGIPLAIMRDSIENLLLDYDDEIEAPGWTALDDRVLRLAQRLVVGCLVAIQHTDNFRDRDRVLAKERGPQRDGPPKHRVVIVGKPLALDVRPAVRAYLGGQRSGIPSVQSLVRGHYKRQVIGVARSGRRVIWVEPYWRGPEDAPILARPYRIGDPAEEQRT